MPAGAFITEKTQLSHGERQLSTWIELLLNLHGPLNLQPSSTCLPSAMFAVVSLYQPELGSCGRRHKPAIKVAAVFRVWGTKRQVNLS